MSITILLLGVGTFISFLFSVHLLTVRTGNLLINRMLGIWFLSRFLDNVLFYAILFDFTFDFPIILKAFAPVFLISPACIFLYVKYFLQDRPKMLPLDWLHFIPFFIGLADAATWINAGTSNWSQVVESIKLSHSYIYDAQAGLLTGRELFLLKNLLSYFYIVLIFYQLYKHKIFKQFKSYQIQHIWLLFLTFSVIINQIARGSTTLAIYRLDALRSGNSFLVFVSIVSLTAVFIILVVLFKNPKLLYGYILLRSDREQAKNFDSQRELHPKIEEKSIRKTSLTMNELEANKTAMIAYMEDSKPFLDPELKISSFSETLHLPQHHCSYILNFVLKKNFRDWINGYRIAYFIKIHGEKSDKMTIEAMAIESGFNNSATFYNAFKKEYGVTPKEFFK